MQIGSIQESVTVSDSDAATLGFFGGSRSSGDRGARICSAPVDGGIGGNLKPPVAVAHAQPIYPPSAQSGKIEGVVILQGRIDTSGLVTDLRVLRSPNADLAGAALEAVSAWRFDATLLNCVPIDTAITVTINFSLSK
jgi:TonB family protein